MLIVTGLGVDGIRLIFEKVFSANYVKIFLQPRSVQSELNFHLVESSIVGLTVPICLLRQVKTHEGLSGVLIPIIINHPIEEVLSRRSPLAMPFFLLVSLSPLYPVLSFSITGRMC